MVLDAASMTQVNDRRGEEAPMTGIVKTVYEDDHHYHMVFKNDSSTRGNTTDEDKRSGAAQGEFKLEKRDLYKERKEQEARSKMAQAGPETQQRESPNNEERGMSDECASNGQ